jgi:hypothetical protein
VLIRVTIPASFTRFTTTARDLGAPVLVSANAFWRGNRFWVPNRAIFSGCDVAVDSAGFVAMLLYWHYRWALDVYVDFIKAFGPTWWAAPDYCCEPEIARDRAEVLSRVNRTAFKLDWARQVAADRGVPPPMPVVQGWFPDDYERCLGLMPDLPSLIGVGSVCRRQLHGPAGIMAVVRRLDEVLPAQVLLHLFGVKGDAIRWLAGHPRVLSVDSAGWDAAARRERERNGESSCTVAYRSGYMRRWYVTQRAGLGLFGS